MTRARIRRPPRCWRRETFGRDNSGDVIVLIDAPDGATVDDPALTQRVNDHFNRLKADNPEHVDHA